MQRRLCLAFPVKDKINVVNLLFLFVLISEKQTHNQTNICYSSIVEKFNKENKLYYF